ncbi:isopentenyl-diphosphate Delta-isomerase [Paractinoplanes durhamensis]|uniref:Isopentenyl-diphosphate Delta-isomerase n=1 Tax=Paractinoplanes durhamensis TaxID=113563 RepID=A0ABQ3YUU6_9ACTN|nr:isopentenyl-diphosphate Delta-isomerase [Actinoplanes durhamensis]GIE01366.1 isopentenyl-diphosphate Delta-isomerase [Actinoplanes durhamensis]
MEHVVLLDESGRARGRHDKRTVHTADTPLHLAFSCYVFDSAGRFLLTQRAAGKQTWPGIWTNSVCGHPQEGESMRAAVARRAEFELGLALDEIRLVLPGFRYRAELDGVVENEMCPVFYATASVPPRLNPAEVGAVRWVPWDGFLSGVLADDPAYSPWCRLQAVALTALGPAPRDWPAGDAAALPPAAGL